MTQRRFFSSFGQFQPGQYSFNDNLLDMKLLDQIIEEQKAPVIMDEETD